MNRTIILLSIIVTLSWWLNPFVGSHPLNTTSAEVTDDDVVATCLLMEARGEGVVGMTAVLNVIQNRADRRKMSLRGVVLQRWQFSCFNAVTVRQSETIEDLVLDAKEMKGWRVALRIVQSNPADITNGSDHYYAEYIKPPYWAKEMKHTVKIGRHIFFDSSQ